MTATIERPRHTDEGLLVDIDPAMPWGEWQTPYARKSSTAHMRVARTPAVVDSQGERLMLVDGDGLMGYPTEVALRELGNRAGFPLDFVQKLPLHLQEQVVNARLEHVDDATVTLTMQPYMVPAPGNRSAMAHPDGHQAVTHMAPGWRGILSHQEVAQGTFNLLAGVYDAQNVTVKMAKVTDAGLFARFTTMEQVEVSPNGRAVGDVIGMGLAVSHRFGVELQIALYIERLACLNGMTTTSSEFEWKSQALGSRREQFEWMMVAVADAVTAFPSVVEKCKHMADTPVVGDVEQIIRERARHMRLPKGIEKQLIAAYQAEPIPTEWGVLQALTRHATHGDITEAARLRLMATAGEWAENFDIVDARLARPVALAVGATILEEGRN